MKFLTGSKVCERGHTYNSKAPLPNRCDSGTDGKVRMKEDVTGHRPAALLRHFPRTVFCVSGFFMPKTNCRRSFANFLKGLICKMETTKKLNVRKLALTAVLGAVATVLMFISFSVPIMPSFIKLDLSELPALIASFAFGPVSGMAVCFIKNLVNLPFTTTSGVGELCNFLLGAAFVLPAGLLYQMVKGRRGALVGSFIGAAAMALLSLPINYFVTYPFYAVFMPMEAILGMYKAINPAVENLFQALLWFNVPFTFVKGLLSVAITFAVYKKISPILKGQR